MTEPEYLRAPDLAAAVAHARRPQTMVMAGGTEVVAWLAAGIVSPARVVDLREAGLDGITVEDEGLSIGATTSLAAVAAHPDVARLAPALAGAVRGAASPAIREQGTLGGNLLQQTRCPYFRGHGACNRRQPGSGCAATTGDHRRAAVLGASPHCLAVHPSDPAVALAGLGADLIIEGPDGRDEWPLERLYALDPLEAHALGPGQLLVRIRIPGGPLAASGRYRKVRDRAAFDFSLVSAATHLTLSRDRVESVTIALGGVAPRPWRCRTAESLLVRQPLSEAAVRAALTAEFRVAAPLPANAFKLRLCEQIVVESLLAPEVVT